MSVSNGAFTRTNSFGGDGSRNYPRFHTEEVQDMAASEIAGRPIFKTEERVEIIMPGNSHTRPVFKVTRDHQQQWPEEYKRWKDGMEMSVEGTPLEQWPPLKRAQVLELKALGFVTVEQVAAMNDLAVQRIGIGGMGLRNLAKAFLDDAEANALNVRLTADSERKDSKIAELSRKVDEMGALVENLHGRLQALQDAPNPLQSHIPGMSDPMERARQATPPPAPAQSSLDDIKPRVRPAKAATA